MLSREITILNVTVTNFLSCSWLELIICWLKLKTYGCVPRVYYLTLTTEYHNGNELRKKIIYVLFYLWLL